MTPMNDVNKEPGLYHYDTGFVIRFPNGYAASIRWGETNYAVSINPDHTDSHMAALDAEAAAWIWRTPKNGETNCIRGLDRLDDGFYHVDGFDYGGDDVLPNMSPDNVAEFIYKVANLPPVEDTK
jgi:hypothetical protein